MCDKKPSKSAYGQLGLTALCAAGLFSVLYIWKGMFPFGDGSIVMTDLYSQYVPLLYRFYDVVCREKNLFMDFSVSGGANLYVDTVNEVINPFNYVLFLFGRDMIYKAVNVILLLYVTAAAVSANFFLLKVWPKRRDWNVVLSLCYGLSGYAAYNFQIIKWLYFPVLFPLFLLALRRLLREKKGMLYAVLLAYQLMLSIQLGFMTLLFVLFGSGIYFYVCLKREERSGAMCRLGLYTLAGLLLSCVVLVPNVLILLSSSRAGENLSYFGVMKRHGLDDLFERLFQIAHPVLLALAVWLTAGAAHGNKEAAGAAHGDKGAEDGHGEKKLSLGVHAGFWKKLPRDGRFLALWNAFLWLTVLLEPANLLWHMGSYVCFPVRYAYMVLLSGICLIKWLLEERADAGRRTKKTRQCIGQGAARRKWTGGLASVGVIACCMAAIALTVKWEERIVQAFSSLAISKYCRTETLMVCGILALLFAAALCAQEAGGRAWSVLAVLACGLCLNLFIMWPKGYEARTEYEAAYQQMTRQAQEERTKKEQAREAAGTPGGHGLDSVLEREKDDPGLPLNAALVNGKNSLSGYFPTASRDFKSAMEQLGYLVPWVATQSVGGTAVSDDLLSMALLLDKSAESLQLQAASVLERQQELAAIATGEKPFEQMKGIDPETEETGVIHLPVVGRQTVYLDPGMTADCVTVFVDGKETEFPEEAAAFSPHRILELGTFTDCEIVVSVEDRNGNPVSADGMELALLDRDRWSLAAEALNGEDLKADACRGELRLLVTEAKEGQTLFLPFASLAGWKCVLNGKTVDISPVLGGFMGISTKSGKNEIVLRFTPPGLMAGGMLTLFGVFGLAVLALLGRKEENALRPAAEKCIGALYRILFAAGIIAVYLIPAAGLAVYLMSKVLGIGG